MAIAAPPRPDARDIFGEVVESLVHERPLAETLGLISRRVCELGAFDFCGILLPDAEGDHVHVAASHRFPPRYVTRLNELFLFFTKLLFTPLHLGGGVAQVPHDVDHGLATGLQPTICPM